MASIKLVYGSTTETCWSDTSKITTPSLILNDGGTIRYTPLFSGSAGGTVVNGNYKYTLGHLVVDGKRVAIGRANNTWVNKIVVSFYYSESTTTWEDYDERGDHYYWRKNSRDYYVRLDSCDFMYGSLTAIWFAQYMYGGYNPYYGGISNPVVGTWYKIYSDVRSQSTSEGTSPVDEGVIGYPNNNVCNDLFFYATGGNFYTKDNTCSFSKNVQTVTILKDGVYP